MATAIIGAVFVDIKGFAFDHYVPTGRNIGSVRTVHGGVCRNVCEIFANQGCTPAFVSMVDDTALGRDVYEHLDALGVDLRYTRYAENGMGLWLAILDEHGELVGSISRQPDFSRLEALIDERGDEIIRESDSVVLEIDMNERIAGRVLELAKRHGKPVYAIVGNMGVILRHPEYLRSVRCFICNEIEAGRLFDADLSQHTPTQMLAALAVGATRCGIDRMVVTMGAQGAVYFDRENALAGFCPAIPSEMVDSTGAGDAFFAGTVMALTRGIALDGAVRIGTHLASETIQSAQSACGRIDGLFDAPGATASA